MASSMRRSTLASIDVNETTGIPLPSSALKAKKYVSSAAASSAQAGASSQPTLAHRSSRQSLAPQRQSMAPHDDRDDRGQAAGSSRISSTPAAHRQSRQSVMGTSSTGRNSTIAGGPGPAGSNVNATPNHRRSINGRQSLAPNAFPIPAMGGLSARPNHNNADPRPLRSREYQSDMKHRVNEYAEATGFSIAGYRGITSLDSPTQAIFMGLFRHIFNHAIEPSYVFAADAKKPEEEVLTLLQEYRYPAAQDISKMLLGSASSQQYWPKALGILDWMVGLSRLAALVPLGPLERERVHNETTAQLVRDHGQAVATLHAAPRTLPSPEREKLQANVDDVASRLRSAEEGPDVGATEGERWFYPFMWKCYAKFWLGEDSFPEEIGDLETFFEKKNASVKTAVAKLETEKARVEAELHELEDGESPLEKAEATNAMYRNDLEKFTTYKEQVLLPKIERTKSTIRKLEAAKIEKAEELQKLKMQHKRLSEQVASQEMSSDEFDRLTAERSALAADKEKLEGEIRDHEKRRYHLEVMNANMQQRLEEKLKSFNPLAAKAGVFPLKVRGSSSRDEYLEEIDLLLGQPSLLHPGLDLKTDLKNRITSIRKELEEGQSKAVGEKVEKQEQYDQVWERLHLLRAQESEARSRLEVIKESIDELTRLTEEETSASMEDANMKERKLQHASQAGHRTLAEIEARLVGLRTHVKQLRTLKDESLEKHKDELCAAVEQVMNLKKRVGESIEDIATKLGIEVQVVKEEETEEVEGSTVQDQEYDGQEEEEE